MNQPQPYYQTPESTPVWNRLTTKLLATTEYYQILHKITNFEKLDLTDEHITYNLLQNPNCPENIVAYHAEINNEDHQIEAALSPALKNSQKAQQTLLNQQNDNINLALATNKHAGPNTLTTLYDNLNENDTTLAATLLANPNLPQPIIKNILEGEDLYQKTLLAKNPGLTETQITQLVKTNNLFVQTNLAQNKNINEQTQNMLANTADLDILSALIFFHAQTLTTQTTNLIYSQLEDHHQGKSWQLLLADNCPEELHQLTQALLQTYTDDQYNENYDDPTWHETEEEQQAQEFINYLLPILAQNRSTPPNLLHQLYKIGHYTNNQHILIALAENPATPKTSELLHNLLDLQNPNINYRLAVNENCDAELAGKLTGIYPDGLIDPDRNLDLEINAILTTNTNLPSEMRATLLAGVWTELEKMRQNNIIIHYQTFQYYLEGMITLADPNNYQNSQQVDQTIKNLAVKEQKQTSETLHTTATGAILINLGKTPELLPDWIGEQTRQTILKKHHQTPTQQHQPPTK